VCAPRPILWISSTPSPPRSPTPDSTWSAITPGTRTARGGGVNRSRSLALPGQLGATPAAHLRGRPAPVPRVRVGDEDRLGDHGAQRHRRDPAPPRQDRKTGSVRGARSSSGLRRGCRTANIQIEGGEPVERLQDLHVAGKIDFDGLLDARVEELGLRRRVEDHPKEEWHRPGPRARQPNVMAHFSGRSLVDD